MFIVQCSLFTFPLGDVRRRLRSAEEQECSIFIFHLACVAERSKNIQCSIFNVHLAHPMLAVRSRARADSRIILTQQVCG